MIFNSDLGFVLKSINGVRTARPEAWLRVTGPDAAVFLQGQCTQDLRRLKSGQAAWALWLSIKGRVQAESLVLRGAGDLWWLWSAHGEGAALAARLEEFIIADDVMVENVGAAAEGEGGWEQVTLAGDAAEAWLRERRGGEAPPAEGAWVEFGGGLLFAGRRGREKIWEWLRPAGAVGEADAPPAELGELREEELVRGRIAAGVAAIPGEFGAQDLPQEAGLEEVAISFTKGCYLGQEVMARLHAMGRVRRRLLRVMGEGGAPVSGAGVFAPGAPGAPVKAVGELRAAVDDGRGGWIGLAMVNLLGLGGAATNTELLLEGGRGVRLLDTL